jgi:hypothetical protein
VRDGPTTLDRKGDLVSENEKEIAELEETDEPDVEAHRFEAHRNDDRTERTDGPGSQDSRVERHA